MKFGHRTGMEMLFLIHEKRAFIGSELSAMALVSLWTAGEGRLSTRIVL